MPHPVRKQRKTDICLPPRYSDDLLRWHCWPFFSVPLSASIEPALSRLAPQNSTDTPIACERRAEMKLPTSVQLCISSQVKYFVHKLYHNIHKDAKTTTHYHSLSLKKNCHMHATAAQALLSFKIPQLYHKQSGASQEKREHIQQRNEGREIGRSRLHAMMDLSLCTPSLHLGSHRQ